MNAAHAMDYPLSSHFQKEPKCFKVFIVYGGKLLLFLELRLNLNP